MENKPIKIYTLSEVKDELIGKPGTPIRELYELELHLDLLGENIKTCGKNASLPKANLGNL